jgi:uncharacterized membrane protein
MDMAIETPFGWGWDRLKLTASSLGSANPDTYWKPDELRPASSAVRKIGLADLRYALAKGVEDFGANRTDVIFVCLIYPIAGLLLARFALGGGLLHLVFPLAAGFALIGPAAAVGLMEMSRRREQGMDAAWGSAFGVVRSPSFGAILLLSLVLLAVFLLWMFVAQSIYDLTLGPKPPVSAAAFVHALFTTGAGWALIIVGIDVGALFAILALAISVVSFPLLLDAPVGIEVAVRTSVRAVVANPVAMVAWGLIVTAGLVIGSVPFLLGLVVVLPVLGHATWHLYRRLMPPR